MGTDSMRSNILKARAWNEPMLNKPPGWFACAAGHVAIWRDRVMNFSGWTIVLEDDATLSPGWDVSDIHAMIESNATKAAALLRSLGECGTSAATPREQLVWLEPRPCL